MKTVKIFSIVGIAGILLGGAFLLGRISTAPTSTAISNTTVANIVNQQSEPGAIKQLGSVNTGVTNKAGNSSAEVAEGSNDPKIETFAYDQAAASVESLRDILLNEAESPEKLAKVQSIMQSLLGKAKSNSDTLRAMIDAYRQNPDSRLGGNLQSVLAELKDPEVVDAALGLSQSTSTEEQLAGLELLAKLDMPSEEVLQITTGIIATKQAEPDVIMAAVHALPKSGIAPDNQNAILQDLSQLAQSNDNAGVRSASIFKVGELAKDADDLSVVTNMLTANNETDDRISAAMAIQQSNVVDDQLKQTLINHMSNPEELWEIRRLSAQSLERFKLSEDEYAAYQRFLEEQGDISLGR